MEERFIGRVRVIWQIDAATLDACVPTLLLQPLLENAFKHGAGNGPGSGSGNGEEPQLTWCWVLVFLGYGRRHLSFSSGLLRWARDASYPIYILHQTIIVAIGYYVIQMSWGPWKKYAVVVSGTLVACVLLYELCIRRNAVMRLLFGMKARTQQSAPVTECVVGQVSV